jgi:hypothetical protein
MHLQSNFSVIIPRRHEESLLLSTRCFQIYFPVRKMMLARVTNVGGGFAAVRQLVHICDIGGSRTAYGDVS